MIHSKEMEAVEDRSDGNWDPRRELSSRQYPVSSVACLGNFQDSRILSQLGCSTSRAIITLEIYNSHKLS